MNIDNSAKPYLIRSIYNWCTDSDFTPFISVKVFSGLEMPTEYINNGEIILNIGTKSVHNILINNDIIDFVARFNGISKK